MIKVSVIIPVYKVPLEYLQACFDSLAAQTMQECEFIVVSDGAPNEERSICEEYAAKDSRFNFFKQEHAGVSATRNYGIDQAQGKYIAFVDADDWIDPETNQIVYDYAFENDSDIVFWDMVKEYPSSSEKKRKLAQPKYHQYKRDVFYFSKLSIPSETKYSKSMFGKTL